LAALLGLRATLRRSGWDRGDISHFEAPPDDGDPTP